MAHCIYLFGCGYLRLQRQFRLTYCKGKNYNYLLPLTFGLFDEDEQGMAVLKLLDLLEQSDLARRVAAAQTNAEEKAAQDKRNREAKAKKDAEDFMNLEVELTEEKLLDVYVKIPLAESENFDIDKVKVTATYKGKEIEVKSII